MSAQAAEVPVEQDGSRNSLSGLALYRERQPRNGDRVDQLAHGRNAVVVPPEHRGRPIGRRREKGRRCRGGPRNVGAFDDWWGRRRGRRRGEGGRRRQRAKRGARGAHAVSEYATEAPGRGPPCRGAAAKNRVVTSLPVSTEMAARSPYGIALRTSARTGSVAEPPIEARNVAQRLAGLKGLVSQPCWLARLGSRGRLERSALANRARCRDRLTQRALKLRARGEGLARPLPPVAQRRARERQVIARLVDEPSRNAEIEQLGNLVDAGPPADLELRFTERGCALVLGDLNAGAAADQILAHLHLTDASDVEPHRRVELERVAAGGGLG